MTDHSEVRRDAEPSLETMRSRIYDPVLYPSMPNQFGDLRADAMRLLDLLDEAWEREAAVIVQRDELQREIRRLQVTGDDRDF